VAAPPPERQAAGALIAFAALGGPVDSVARLGSQLERWVESLRPDRRQAAHSALLDRAAVLGFPDFVAFETHRLPNRGSYLLELHAAAARLDTTAVRAGIDRIWRVRAALRPGDIGLTAIYQESLLLLLLNDTTAAVRHLDGVLQDLTSVRSDVIPDIAQTASLVRAMALRAALADKMRDTMTSRWWARNVLALWSEADPPLASVVRNMRGIAGEPN
jgi:hypothetical protein